MNQHTIKKSSELFDLLKRYRKSTLWKFRGQSDISWKLLPKAGRPPYTNFSDQKLFGSWKKRAIAFLDKKIENEWELLAIAQHNGLPTRLLDWSHNPLVAIFFSVIDDHDKDGVVYAHHAESYINEETTILFSNTFKKNVRYWPNAVSTRITNQFGCFTYHFDPKEEMSELNSFGELEKITISKELKKELTFTLNQYGINYLTIYPDLEGLSRHLAWHGSNSEFWNNKIFEI